MGDGTFALSADPLRVATGGRDPPVEGLGVLQDHMRPVRVLEDGTEELRDIGDRLGPAVQRGRRGMMTKSLLLGAQVAVVTGVRRDRDRLGPLDGDSRSLQTGYPCRV